MNINEETNKIILPDESGNKKEYDIVDYITLPTGNYILYTDNEVLPNGNIKTYINSLIKDNKDIILSDITEEEKQLILKEINER